MSPSIFPKLKILHLEGGEAGSNSIIQYILEGILKGIKTILTEKVGLETLN